MVGKRGSQALQDLKPSATAYLPPLPIAPPSVLPPAHAHSTAHSRACSRAWSTAWAANQLCEAKSCERQRGTKCTCKPKCAHVQESCGRGAHAKYWRVGWTRNVFGGGRLRGALPDAVTLRAYRRLASSLISHLAHAIHNLAQAKYRDKFNGLMAQLHSAASPPPADPPPSPTAQGSLPRVYVPQ